MAPPTKYTDAFLGVEAEALIVYANQKSLDNKKPFIPFFKDFCALRGYPSKYIFEIIDKNKKFSEAHSRMKDIQEMRIVKLALNNEINSTFAIFTLKNVAGWRDVQNIKHSSDPAEPLNVNITNLSDEELARAITDKIKK